MKKYIVLICILAFLFTGCGSEKPFNSMTYIDGEIGTYVVGETSTDVVYVYTEYTNSSGVPAVPADFLEVKAYQNDTELEPLFFSRERINDYVQCNKVIHSGDTYPVVWIFQRIDNSPVSVAMDTGTKTEHYTLSIAE